MTVVAPRQRLRKRRQGRGSPEWRRLRRLADNTEYRYRRVLRAWLEGLRDAASVRALVRAIRAGDVDAAVRAFGLAQGEQTAVRLQAPLRQAMRDAITEAARVTQAANAGGMLAGAVTAGWSFDVLDARAVEYMRTQSSRLVVQVTESTRQGIRTALADAMEIGLGPARAAEDLKEVVGLHSRFARAVVHYRQRQLQGGATVSQARERTARYARELRRHRTHVIARTEAIDSVTRGQQALWEEAVSDGILDTPPRQRWVVTWDDRLCDLCAPMDGEEADLNGAFSGGVSGPPRHPNCRCALEMVFPTGARA